MKLKAFIPTEDLERAVTFYRDVVGLEVVSRDEYGAHVRSGDTLVRITTARPFEPQPFTVLGWQVDDIAAEVGRLVAAGNRSRGHRSNQRLVITPADPG